MDTVLLIFLLTLCSLLGGIVGGYLFTVEFRRWFRALENEIADVADTLTREVKKRAASASVQSRRTLADEMEALEEHVTQGAAGPGLLGSGDFGQAGGNFPARSGWFGSDSWRPARRTGRGGDRGATGVGLRAAEQVQSGGSGSLSELLPWNWAISRGRRSDGPADGSAAIQDHRT